LDELVGGDGNAEHFGKLGAASLFGLTTTVGEENVWELNT
jgi:hypothetical protein